MTNAHTFYFFAFTYRSFFYGESGPARCGREVQKT